MSKTKLIRAVPNLVRKELIALLLACAILALFSALFDAPMEGPADPKGVPTENVKAPWIFVGIQQMLKILPPELAGIVIPLISLIILTLSPFMFHQRKPSYVMFFGILGVASALTLWGYLS